LRSIGEAIKLEDGSISKQALNLRLSEQYIKAIGEVYAKSNIVTLPEPVEGQESSSNISASTIATAFALYK